MATLERMRRRRRSEEPAPARRTRGGGATGAAPVPVPIEPDDPLLEHLRRTAAPVELAGLDLVSDGLTALRAAGVVLVVPLVTSGELVGVLNLGPRRSDQGYSADDRRLLDTLAGHVAPALRVRRLLREREVVAREQERTAQELQVAQVIQQEFLPRELPDPPGWALRALYRPARSVGGDFYDVLPLDDGRLMVVCGDVTDKGVPAALVMASTHALLRENGPRHGAPGTVLARVNELLCADIPEHMFVTCLILVLDPASGELWFANAGHNLPYVRGADGVRELRATGMPLGLLPGMVYDESHAVLAPGECLLLHSDGLAEAHDERREMFGLERVAALVGAARSGADLIDDCLRALDVFAGPDAEQEDDITLLTIERTGPGGDRAGGETVPRTALSFSVPSEPGSERDVVDRVGLAASDLGMTPDRVERLRTAVGETVSNAIEHGNGGDPDLPVEVALRADGRGLVVSVSDRGGPFTPPDEEPDLLAKLDGRQSPRGWGLFLARHMVDGLRTVDVDPADPDRHTVELELALDDTGARDG